jgi:hypothetical protein
MAHGDAREGKWRGNWRMEWVDSTLRTTVEQGVSSIYTADAHTSAASSRLKWRPCRFKWTRPFRRKTKSGFCACAITFQLASTNILSAKDHKSEDLIDTAAEAWNHETKSVWFSVAFSYSRSFLYLQWIWKNWKTACRKGGLFWDLPRSYTITKVYWKIMD